MLNYGEESNVYKKQDSTPCEGVTLSTKRIVIVL